MVIVVLAAASSRAAFYSSMSLSNTNNPDRDSSAIISKTEDSNNSAPASPAESKAQQIAEFDSSGAAPQISLASTSENLPDIGQGICLRTEMERFEKELITRALKLAKGRQKVAAQLLGVGPSTLHSKIKRHNLRAGEWESISK